MGIVVSSASVSLDGFIAFPDDSIGELFAWYDSGDVEVVNAGELPSFHLTRASADYWNDWVSGLGCLVVGRRLFDVTDGWHGRHPMGCPVVVVTHEAPTDWSYPGSEDFTFVTDGVVAAIERARGIAGGRDVGVAAGTIAAQALVAGVLDEVAMDIVPVVMGAGKPYFPDVPQGSILLGDPTSVVPSARATHVRFPVIR
jgi:dihydrofolate reductase